MVDACGHSSVNMTNDYTPAATAGRIHASYPATPKQGLTIVGQESLCASSIPFSRANRSKYPNARKARPLNIPNMLLDEIERPTLGQILLRRELIRAEAKFGVVKRAGPEPDPT
jgi:hypothetical protein